MYAPTRVCSRYLRHPEICQFVAFVVEFSSLQVPQFTNVCWAKHIHNVGSWVIFCLCQYVNFRYYRYMYIVLYSSQLWLVSWFSLI